MADETTVSGRKFQTLITRFALDTGRLIRKMKTLCKSSEALTTYRTLYICAHVTLRLQSENVNKHGDRQCETCASEILY